MRKLCRKGLRLGKVQVQGEAFRAVRPWWITKVAQEAWDAQVVR